MDLPFKENYISFVEKALKGLKEKKVDYSKYFIDHISYTVPSVERYEEMKTELEKIGTKLVEIPVFGHKISSFKLKEPLDAGDHKIPLIELPSPKDESQIEGFDHIEMVLDTSLEEFRTKYPEIDFDERGLKNTLNPELEIKFEGFSIKFHCQSLEEVIKYEKEHGITEIPF